MSQDNQLINNLIKEVNSIRRELDAIKTQTFVSNSDGTDDAITNPGKILKATGAGQLVLAKLGIGVLSPQEILEVSAASGGRAIFSDGQGSNRKGLLIQSAGTSVSTHSRLESWNYQSSSGLGLSINPGGGSIGLGTTEMDDAFLTVAGNALFVGDDGHAKFKRQSLTNGGHHIQDIRTATTGYSRTWSGSNAWWDESANLFKIQGIGANDTSGIIHDNGGLIRFISHVSSGTSDRTMNLTSFKNGTKMVIENSGNVGIGTTSPSYLLDVTGTARFSNTSNPGLIIGNGSIGYLQVGSAGWYDDATYFSPRGSRSFYIRSTTPNYFNYSPNIYLGSTTGTTILTRGNAVRIGANVSGQDADLLLTTYSASYNAQKFYFQGTLVGELGAGDSTWFRINQSSGKNIYTPRMIRADTGLQVGSSGEDFHVTSAGYVGINKASPAAYMDFNLGGCDLTSFTNGFGLFVDTAGGWARGMVIDNLDKTDEGVAFGGLTGLAFISAEFDQSSDTTGYLARKFTMNGNGQTSIGTTTIHASAMLTVGGHIWPLHDNASDLGGSSKRWDDVYATNGTIQTSDRRNKAQVRKSKLGLEFLRSLRPVSYKWKDYERVDEEDEDALDKDGNPYVKGKKTKRTQMKFKRRHYGLIAQEVEQALKGKDFAGLTIDDEGTYGLRYTEFISPIIKSIQEMADRIEELENKLGE